MEHNQNCASTKFFEDQGKFISCKADYIKSRANLKITFKMNNFNIVFSIPQLFQCKNDYSCNSIIREKIDMSENWSFGTFFFQQVVTTFDHETKSIEFYGNSPILSNLNQEFQNCKKYIVVIVIVGLSVWSFILIIAVGIIHNNYSSPNEL